MFMDMDDKYGLKRFPQLYDSGTKLINIVFLINTCEDVSSISNF